MSNTEYSNKWNNIKIRRNVRRSCLWEPKKCATWSSPSNPFSSSLYQSQSHREREITLVASVEKPHHGVPRQGESSREFTFSILRPILTNLHDYELIFQTYTKTPLYRFTSAPRWLWAVERFLTVTYLPEENILGMNLEKVMHDMDVQRRDDYHRCETAITVIAWRIGDFWRP